MIGALLLLLVGAVPLAAQTLTKEQKLSKLRLQEGLLLLAERRESLQSHREELQATRELFDQGFVALQKYNQTLNRFEQARLNFEDAEIRLEKVKLNLLKNATHIVVDQARKYKTADGKSMVDLTLGNESDIRDALLVDESLSEEELRILLKIENIYVSLRYGPIVGEPYEVRIPSLAVGERHSLTFRLLADEKAVFVDLSYLDLKESKPVILKKGSLQDLPSINSSQFSQEGELNQSVSFGLTLQRLSDDERNFALAAVGLPQRIDYSFNNGGAKVNQVKFDENTSKVQLQLQLDIPEKLAERFIGRTRAFFALVTQPSEYAQINALRARYGDDPIPETDIEALKSNYVKLELIPKGIGELEVLVSNRYQEIKIDEELHIRVEFLNRGTVAVQNIKAVLDLPYDWEEEVDPTLIKILHPGGRAAVNITARPPYDIAVGDYEIGIEAQGQVGTENIESLEKNITVRVGARSNVAGNTILIGILVLLVCGIGLASVKISRR